MLSLVCRVGRSGSGLFVFGECCSGDQVLLDSALRVEGLKNFGYLSGIVIELF